MTLAYAGCRLPALPRALALTVNRINLAAGVLAFESLKSGAPGFLELSPSFPALLSALDMVHGICERHSRRGKGPGVRLKMAGSSVGSCRG